MYRFLRSLPTLALLLMAMLTMPLAAQAQTCGIAGLDGPATPAGVINSYHAGAAGSSASAGSNQVTVATTTGQRTSNRVLRAGDMVLIMQMQHSGTPGNAGLYEYALISSIAGNVLTLNRNLTNSYQQLVNTTNVQTFQVVYVPQYSQATLSGVVTADRWSLNTANGAGTGGVVAMDVAGSMSLTGSIEASGAGFRGGAGINGSGNRAGGLFTDANYNFSTAAPNGALKGEGIAGTPLRTFNGTATPDDYTTLLAQGYAAGAAGRAAQGNAGGGGNDGTPASSGNALNSGGGGGSNGAQGGQGGFSWQVQNDAGGRGAPAIASSISRLVMGGGGGAGSSNNNNNGNAVTVWPPTDNATTRATPPATGAVNGADGPISVSGASGGGIVFVRAGTLTGAGSINANGYTAFNTSGGSEGAGGGGGGGSVVVLTGNATSSAFTINVNGGKGGYSNYYDHGPGGGGGSGIAYTNFTTAAINLNGGVQGYDGCCGNTQGNGSPKFYNSVAGSNASAITSGGSPSGLQGGASCLPVLSVTKTALQRTITAATAATTSYSISLSNTGGAATNVYLFDANLPPGWAYAATPVTVYSYSPTPPGAASSGAETTAAVLPAGLPVNAATSANSAAAVSLRANGAAPGVVPTTGANSPTFGSFFIAQNGSVTLTFAVTIPDSAAAGTYHNPAGVVFLDPTRANAVRLVTPATNRSANRAGVAYSDNAAYASGATGAVAGSNFSGLENGPASDDVILIPDFSVSKTASTTTFTIGQSGLNYTIVGRNNGRGVTDQVYASTQASSQSATVIASAKPTITDTLPTGMTVTATTNSAPGIWTCTPNANSTTFACSASTAVYPMAAASNLVTITATVSVSNSACPGPLTNTAVITSPALGDTLPANNTATAVTSIGCATNLTVVKTDGVAAVNSGSTTVYTVTFSNLGPAAADGALVRDIPGAGLNCTSVTCSAVTGGASCPAGLPLGVATPIGSTTFFGAGSTIAAMPSVSTVALAVSCGVTATGQ